MTIITTNLNTLNITSIMMSQIIGPIMIKPKDRLKHTQKEKVHQQVNQDLVDQKLQLKARKDQVPILHTNTAIILLETIGHLMEIVTEKVKTFPITGRIMKHKTIVLMQFHKVKVRLLPKLQTKTLEPLLKVK